ncbi:MAG: hypothetical protein NWE89_01745 [Candidatus Bathyarchaeota archaeon]|nr:hypothetical protein [Candidatus Bathyarchaeota archaeon]
MERAIEMLYGENRTLPSSILYLSKRSKAKPLHASTVASTVDAVVPASSSTGTSSFAVVPENQLDTAGNWEPTTTAARIITINPYRIRCLPSLDILFTD